MSDDELEICFTIQIIPTEPAVKPTIRKNVNLSLSEMNL